VFAWLFRALDTWRHRLRLRKMPAHLAWGARAEDLAHRYLESIGLKVVARNWTRPGRKEEIDLVAVEGERLVVVEVKSRHTAADGSPDRNIDWAKRGRTSLAGLRFARDHRVAKQRLRFDEVTIVFQPFRIEHRRDAWSLKEQGLG